MKLRFAALSDVGRVRKDNQDAGYAGPHLLVVADGVGGSARGDLASSTTVEQLRKLDDGQQNSRQDGATDTDQMLEAVAGAIQRSHDRIIELVQEHPEVDGTSTTVTAALFDGHHIAIGHVGDSRGYLLRDGRLSQLTTDHTFVQTLIDDGQITESEARTHPHRNLILRAVDGVHEPEPDVFTLELAPGDRLMLCSDGCAGALDADDIARLLREGSPDFATVELVRASLEAGSSDNVTVLVADVVPDDAEDDPEAASSAGPLLVGAAAEQPRKRLLGRMGRTRTGELPPIRDDVPAGGHGGLLSGHRSQPSKDDTDPEAMRYAPRPPGRFMRVRTLAMVGVVLLLLAAALVAGYRWSQSQYYVGSSGEHVVIYRGVAASVPGIELSHVQEGSELTLDRLPTYNARQVRDTIPANSLAEARSTLSRLQGLACPVPSPTPTPTPAPSPTASPSAPAPSAPPKKNNKNQQQPPATPAPSPTPSPSPGMGSGCGSSG